MENKLNKEEKIRIKSMKMAQRFYRNTSINILLLIEKAKEFESYIKNNKL